jgi:hypothetical protein
MYLGRSAAVDGATVHAGHLRATRHRHRRRLAMTARSNDDPYRASWSASMTSPAIPGKTPPTDSSARFGPTTGSVSSAVVDAP